MVCCPFCRNDITITKKNEIVSFEAAICRVIEDMTIEILKERQRFIAYLLDVSNEYKKEIHILANACDNTTFEKLYMIAQNDEDTASVKLKMLQKKLVNEEGISDTWANTICKAFCKAFGFNIGYDLLIKNDTNDKKRINPQVLNSDNVEIEKATTEDINIKPGEEVDFGNKTNWKVLDVTSNGVLLCDYTFDEKHSFNNKWSSKVSWENCDLRKWLNDDYIKQICSSHDSQFIISTKIYTKDHNVKNIKYKYFIETDDKVFCLSILDMNKYKKLFSNSGTWLLRDKGFNDGYVATYTNGQVDIWGVVVDYETNIKPCINVAIEYFYSKNVIIKFRV